MNTEIVRTSTSLTEGAVSALLEAARQTALENSTPMTIAISDPAGHLQGLLRMDGAPLLSLQLAQDKAYTAASFGIPTDQWHEFIKNDPPLAAGIPTVPRLVVFGGGIPLRIDGELVGAIGVSGGHYTQDMAVAQAAVEALSA